MSTPDSQVKCQSCGHATKVNFATCLRDGWPMCCGLTMEMLGTQADIEQAVSQVIDDKVGR